MDGRDGTMRNELRVREACPKRWEELSGDDATRFCSACSLHVHNSRALTRAEAFELVRKATGRVCMRIEQDTDGRAVFKDSAFKDSAAARRAGWVAAAGASLLAACGGGETEDGEAAPHPPGSSETPVEGGGQGETAPELPPATLGEVCVPEILGDVALPEPELGIVAPQEILGRVAPVLEVERPAEAPEEGTPEQDG